MSRFSPGIGPITGLKCIHVVKEVDIGALAEGVLYLSLVSTKKATLEAK
jgi:hypothetical protein